MVCTASLTLPNTQRKPHTSDVVLITKKKKKKREKAHVDHFVSKMHINATCVTCCEIDTVSRGVVAPC